MEQESVFLTLCTTVLENFGCLNGGMAFWDGVMANNNKCVGTSSEFQDKILQDDGCAQLASHTILFLLWAQESSGDRDHPYNSRADTFFLLCPYEGSTRWNTHSFELETKTLTHTQPHTNLLWVPCALELTKARYCHWSDRSTWPMWNETTTQQWRCPDYFLSTLHKLELSGKRNCH